MLEINFLGGSGHRMSLFYKETIGHSRMADNNGNGNGSNNDLNFGLENNTNAIQAALAAQSNSTSSSNENEETINLGLENNTNAIQAALAAQEAPAAAAAAAASLATPITEDKEESEAEPRVGDTVQFTYKDGEAEISVKGIIYTSNDTVFCVLKEGSSSEIQSFEMIKEEDGVNFKVQLTRFGITPREPPAKVLEVYGLAQDKTVQLYKNGESMKDADGTPKLFRVESINGIGESDKATLVNMADPSEKYELDFSEGGIPYKFHTEFDLIFVLGDKESEPSPEDRLRAAEAATEGSSPGDGDDVDVSDILEFLGGIPDTLREAKAEEAQLGISKAAVMTEEDQIESFLRGLLMDLTFDQQKNPMIRKRIETLVQALNLLRKSILTTNQEGELEQRSLTIQRLADALRNKKMPLSRPIYQTKRVIVTENTEPSSIDSKAARQLNIENLQDSLESYTNHMEAEKSHQVTLVEEAGKETLPRFYSFLREQIRNFSLGDIYDAGPTTIQSDTDFFRHSIPEIQGTPLYGLEKVAARNEKTGKEETVSKYDPSDYINTDHSFSLRRALAQDSLGDTLQTTTTKGYIVFPTEAASEGIVGAKRSGRLVETIKRSQMPKIPMQYALTENIYGPIDKSGRNLAKAVYYDELLDENTTTNSADSIEFKEYLKTMLETLFFEGPADLNPLKLDLGIEEFELTKEQMEIVRQRIAIVLEKLKMYITSLGQTAEKTLNSTGEPINNSFFKTQVSKYQELGVVYEPLGKALAILQEQTTNYSKVDIAIVAYCLRLLPDYFFAVLTQNPEKIKT